MSDGLKTQLDRIIHAVTTRHGPLPSLYLPTDEERPWLRRPASAAQVEEAERLLGFALPTLLKAIYLRLANGGGALNLYGLCPVSRRQPEVWVRQFDIVAFYLDCVASHPTDYSDPWPEKRIPFFYHGCSVVSCIDCASPEGTVWLVNEGRWQILNPTLAEYVEDPFTPPWPF